VLLKRSFPSSALDFPDPFLLFDHFGSDRPEDYLAGFPEHPHRGIETVTYLLAGKVTHRDSTGNAGMIAAGDVQWMTAGGGIMHEEMPAPVNGKMEGFQLWLNLPARLKMTEPRYQGFDANQIPVVQREDGITIRVIAGTAADVTGPVVGVAADPVYLDVRMPAETLYSLPVAPDHTVLAYLYRGQASFGRCSSDGALLTAPRMVIFGPGDQVDICTDREPGQFLLMMGQPIGEPIVRYGPFVMNSQEEISQALRDLRSGTFVKNRP
jgi:quercetin 2,3-dioxygenase